MKKTLILPNKKYIELTCEEITILVRKWFFEQKIFNNTKSSQVSKEILKICPFTVTKDRLEKLTMDFLLKRFRDAH